MSEGIESVAAPRSDGRALRFAASLLRVGFGIGCVLASLLLHLPTRAGRAALRDLAAHAIPVFVPGRLRVGSIDALSPTEIALSEVSFADERGAQVVEGLSLSIRPAWRLLPALQRGEAMPAIRLRARKLWAFAPYFSPTPPPPPDNSPPPSLLIPEVSLAVDVLEGRIPDVPLRGRGVRAEVGLRLHGGVTHLTRAALRGELDVMNLGPTSLTLNGRGTFADKAALDADLALRGAALGCDLALRSEASGQVRASVRGCALSASALDRIAGSATEPLGLGVRVESLYAQGDPARELNLRGRLALNSERVDLAAQVGPTRQSVELTLTHLSAARVHHAAPSTDLHGSIRVQRELRGTAQVVSVSTARLLAAVAGVPVPPIEARARVDGQRITIERLESQGIGLQVSGDADLGTGDVRFRASASVDTQNIASFPWVARRASGSLRARLEASSDGRRITARLQARSRGLRARGLSIGAVDLDADVTRRGERNVVSARLDATAVTASTSVRDVDLGVEVRGDPSASLSATIQARGEGLLAALGHVSAARERHRRRRRSRARGDTAIEARVAVELSSPRRVRVQIEPSTLRLRGATALASGSVTVPRGDARGAPEGRVRLDLGARGAVGVALAAGRATVAAERFDLRWLHPFVPQARDIEGLLDGTVAVNPARLGQTRAQLRLRRARVPSLGACEASVELHPGRDALALRATLDTEYGRSGERPGARAELNVRVEPPRRTGDPNAWLAGLRDAHLRLRQDLASLDDMLPPGNAARGAVEVLVDAVRARERAPLSVVARVEAPSLTVGVRGVHGYAPAVDPMAVRAVACTSLAGGDLSAVPVRVRLALGPASSGAPDQPPDCGDAPLLARTFFAASGGLQGAWRDALTRLSADLARSTPHLSAETRAVLRRTRVDLDASVGPLARADWPLRAVPRGRGRGRVELVPPPELPRESVLHATVATHGTLLDAPTELGVEFNAPSLPVAGVREAVRARLSVRLAPERGDLFGRLGVRVEGLTQLGVGEAEDQRSELRIDGSAFGQGAALIARGSDAMTLDHLSVATRNLRLERFEWARAQGLRGELDLALRHTRDPTAPVTLRARLAGLRARLGVAAESRLSDPVTATVNAVLRSRGRQGWTLHACTEAEPRGAAEGEGCDPMDPRSEAAPGSLRASLTLPIEGTPAAPRPVVDQVEVGLSARRFRLDALAAAMRGSGVAGLEGVLDGAMRWSRGSVGPEGELRVSQGTAEVASVGERLRGLELSLRAEGGRLTLADTRFQLGDGRVTLRGSADISGVLARDEDPSGSRALATLRLEADASGLPLGAEGNTYGWVDGHVTFSMRALAGGASGDLVIDRATVRLKEQESRDLQPLGADPDVFELGRTRAPVVRSESAYPVSVAFSIPNSLFLERSDLGVEIRGSGLVSRERGGWGVAGLIERAGNRGWFSVFGKRFAIERLRVGLDGGVSVNPTLDISAIHSTVTGDRLTATVGGNLRAPTLGFASANYPSASEVEVLAMLALGRSGSQSASSSGDLGAEAGAAFASLLGAMTFGSLSRGMRVVPTLILEPGQGNAGRYGAGVTLGPRFYLQATYGASGSAAQGTSASSAGVFRVLLEVALSHAWSASVAATANAEAQGGGVDVFWSP